MKINFTNPEVKSFIKGIWTTCKKNPCFLDEWDSLEQEARANEAVR